MEEITLGQVKDWVVWITAFGGGLAIIVKAIKSTIANSFKPLEDKIDKVDKNATMNYLVRCMEDIEHGEKIDGVLRKRFIDQYEHYTKDLKGNTYIVEEYERLKKEGKL